MELLPALRVDISALGYADYRRAPAAEPLSPLRQLRDHIGRAVGRRVRVDELVLSCSDALEVELRTKEFVWTFTRGSTAHRLWSWWVRESRPRVSLRLRRGEADVEARGDVAEKKSSTRQRRVNKPRIKGPEAAAVAAP